MGRANCLIEPIVGVGLRPPHFLFLESKPKLSVKWFEAITENFIDSEGRPLEVLELIRSDYPVSLHGVSLSIGQSDLTLENGLMKSYLEKLKTLIKKIDPFLVSDHLCWTGLQGSNLHNLLPLPYNDETINFILPKIDFLQSFLGRIFMFENLSAYFDYTHSTYSEWEFLKILVERSGCKILLDVNNIYVNSINHHFDPLIYLQSIPSNSVAEIHLAGYSNTKRNGKNFLFDTHDQPVHPPVWDLFKVACEKFASAPVLIEWDDSIPEFGVLEAEALKAKGIWEEVHTRKSESSDWRF